MKSCRDCGGGHRLFAMTQPAQQPETVLNVLSTKFWSGFKSLLTLLELIGVNLHDEKVRGVTPEVWTGMTASETGGAAWTGRSPAAGPRSGCGGDGHRRGRHDRRRRLHQPRLSGQGHPFGLFDPVVVGRGGIVALCGVFSYSELGAMFPRSSANITS